MGGDIDALGAASIDGFGNPENRNRNLADFGRFVLR
jgi:hypothetical protein